MPRKVVPLNFESLRYFHRKYQFSNLIRSKYYGLIFSRLYIGSLTMEDFEQDFTFSYEPGSLAEFLHRKSYGDPNLSIFTGSSYATRELVRLSAYLGIQDKFEMDFIGDLSVPRNNKERNSPTKRFKLFAGGMLPPDSWEV